MTPRGTLTASMWLSILYIFVFYNRYNQEVALSRSFRMVERLQRKRRIKNGKNGRSIHLPEKKGIYIMKLILYCLTHVYIS